MTIATGWFIFAILLLLAFSAFFSAAETAFSSLNKTRLKTYAENGDREAARAVKLLDRYDELLSAILIGNNVVNIVLASIGTVLFVRCYGPVGTTISVAVITVLVLVLGEITPKSIAKDCPERFAVFSASFLQLLIIVLKPLGWFFAVWKRFLAKVLHLHGRDVRTSQEELLMFVDEVQEEGAINKNESELLRNAIEFAERTAKDILTPRVRLGAVSIDAPKEEVGRIFSETKFSRLLVYRENIDNIIGVVHLKNFYEGTGITGRSLREILSPAVFVSTTEKISTILRRLQQKQAQVAVVLDEFGGTYGIVSMEDVLEELVGEIWDEMDHVVIPFKKTGDRLYRVDAAVELEDFCDYFHVELESEMVSVSGWVMEQMHGLPHQGDSFTAGALQITVISVKQRCVSLIEVRILSGETADISCKN